MSGNDRSIEKLTASYINPNAANGFANGELYDSHRPSYDPEAVNSLLKGVHLLGAEGSRVLDLGAGTGKFTELLAAREERFSIVAVEPVDRMRQVLERKRLENVEVKAGSAHEIPLEDGAVDAVVVAQVCCVVPSALKSPSYIRILVCCNATLG